MHSLSVITALLRKRGFEATGEEMSDLIWVHHLEVLAAPFAPKDSPAAKSPSPAQVAPPSPLSGAAAPPRRGSTQTAGTETGEDDKETASAEMGLHYPSSALLADPKVVPGRKVSAASGRALAEPIRLARALLPLRERRVETDRRFLDVEAMVERFCRNGGIWEFQPRRKREPGQEVVLVLEQTPSVLFWEAMAGELAEVFSGMLRLPARMAYLRFDGAERPNVSRGRRDPGDRERVLLQPGRRRLLLVFSDGTSRAWQDGRMGRTLHRWAAVHPTTLVLPFSQDLAQHTDLSRARIAHGRVGEFGTSEWAVRPERAKHPVFLLTLHPALLAPWTKAIRTQPSGYVAAADLPRVAAREVIASPNLEERQVPVDVDELLQRFRDSASRRTRELASLLAAVPLFPPVMRLVQEVFREGSTHLELAEFLYSGLIYRQTDDPEIPSDDFLFEFRNELPDQRPLREQLRDGSTFQEVDEVLRYVGSWVGARFGFEGRRFEALLLGETGGERVEITDKLKPFAKIFGEVLRTTRRAELGQRLQAAAGGGASVINIEPTQSQERRAVEPPTQRVGPEPMQQPLRPDDRSPAFADTADVSTSESAERPRDELSFSACCPDFPKSLPKGQRFQLELTIQAASQNPGMPDSKASLPADPKKNRFLVGGGVELALVFHPAMLRFAESNLPKRTFTVLWAGETKIVQVDLICPDSVVDSVFREIADVFLAGVPVGAIELELLFEERGPETASVNTRFVATSPAYACYAAEDYYEVIGRVDHVKAVLPRLELVLGAEALRSGENTRSRLKEVINQTSRFLLFWSSQAQQSEDVQWEWRYAVETKGVGAVDLVPIDANAPPPKELRSAYERALLRPNEMQITAKRSGPHGMSFASIRAGTFVMGSPAEEQGRSDNEVLHEVTLTRAFEIAETPVTQAQWIATMGGENPSRFREAGPEAPVENVNWEDAVRFCDKLSEEDPEWTYRLPTEAEWEYFCRAGSKGPYNVDGLSLEDLGWFQENAGDTTHPVKQKHPNAWGLYDCSGNVHEWCQDWYDSNLGSEPVMNPEGPTSGSVRVLRGGGWSLGAQSCRSAWRGIAKPGFRLNGLIGFRPVRQKRAAKSDAPEAVAMARVSTRNPELVARDFVVPVLGIKMVALPAGSFIMGEGEDSHPVTLTEDFFLAETPITQAQWQAVMGDNPSHFQGLELPVEQVSWHDATSFCAKLNEVAPPVEGWEWALPTEAQWEYACRAATMTAYGFGDSLNETQVNCGDDFRGPTEQGEHDLYLCHSKRDRHVVEILISELRLLGYAPWFYEEQIRQGADWELEIAAGIRRSGCVVFVASINSYLSDNCRNELVTARNLNKRIIPLVLDREAFPDYLAWLARYDQIRYAANGSHMIELKRVFPPRQSDRDASRPGKTTPVKRYQPNAWGLYDMHGNVWEWCADWYEDFPKEAASDPERPETGGERVRRGGSWNSSAGCCRSAFRDGINPGNRSSDLGFRPVVTRKISAQRSAPITDSDRSLASFSTAISRRPDYVAADFTNSFGMYLVCVEPGTFTMGSPLDELGREAGDAKETPHQVTLTQPFWIAKTPVTQGVWHHLMGRTATQGDQPVYFVTWAEALECCDLLTEREAAAGRLPENYVYTLPTEAQWEYACRAGTTGPYNVDGADLGSLGWYEANSERTTHPVAQKVPNAWGLHDFHGSAWEWCADWYQEDLGPDSTTDPAGPDSGSYRVIRGGGWSYAAPYCRSAYRDCYDPSETSSGIGFRPVLAPKEQRERLGLITRREEKVSDMASSAPAIASPRRSYWCFLSYRHSDNREPGRQWASWVRHIIEEYQVPKDLVGRVNNRGDTIPERIFPVFQDEDELAAGSLQESIERALEMSKSLVVLCSPGVLESAYVDQEIRAYKRLLSAELRAGKQPMRAEPLVVILSGNPGASTGPDSCLPASLRYELDESGSLTDRLKEPLGIDFRLSDGSEGWTSGGAYRDAMKRSQHYSQAEIERRGTEYEARLDGSRIKLIAGILGVPVSELANRENAKSPPQDRRRGLFGRLFGG